MSWSNLTLDRLNAHLREREETKTELGTILALTASSVPLLRTYGTVPENCNQSAGTEAGRSGIMQEKWNNKKTRWLRRVIHSNR